MAKVVFAHNSNAFFRTDHHWTAHGAFEAFEGKPTGTVYVALADKNKVYIKRLAIEKSPNEREIIRYIASTHALDMLQLYLANDPDLMKSGVALSQVDEKL